MGNKKYSYFFLYIFFLFFPFTITYTNNVDIKTFNITQSINSVLQYNPTLYANLKELQALDIAYHKTKTRWMPNFNINCQLVFNKNEPFHKNSNDAPTWIEEEYKELYQQLILPSDSEEYHSEVNLSLTQLLLDNGEVRENINNNKLKKEHKVKEIEQLKQKLILQTYNNYMNLCLLKQNMELQNDIYKQNNNNYKLLQRKSTIEPVDPIQILEKQLEVEENSQKIKELNNKYEAQLAQLKRITGCTGNIKLIPAWDSFVFTKQLGKNLGVNNNKIELQKIKHKIQNTKSKLKASKSYPKATLHLNKKIFKNHELFSNAVQNLDHEFAIAINFVWDVWDGGQTKFAVQEETIRKKILAKEIMFLQDQVKDTVFMLLKKIQLAESKKDLAQKKHELTLKKLAQKKLKYIYIKNSKDDLINYEIEKKASLLVYHTSIYEYNKLIISLLFFTGKLSKEYIESNV